MNLDRPHRLFSRMVRTVCLVVLVGLVGPLGHAGTSHAAPASQADETTRAAASTPSLRTTVLAAGLDLPWEVQKLPGTRALIFTELETATLSVIQDGRVRRLAFPSETVWRSGRTGLMGLAVDPGFAVNRRIYTCQGGFTETGHDVRVMAWTLDRDLTTATAAGLLLSGITATDGQHGGCRLLISSDRALLVATGDAKTGTAPRDLDALGGKTLRLNRFTGRPWPSNPYIGGQGPRRYVFTFGHRNLQGLAERADGTLWSAEHGTDEDDEVNRLVPGGDYGWNPVPGYNQHVPMTDQSLPGEQVEASWSSGTETVATSGASFVAGEQWGELDGALAVACLKGRQVLFLTFDADGELVATTSPPELRAFGRIRTVTPLTNGDLLLTTGNGPGEDMILRVRARTS